MSKTGIFYGVIKDSKVVLDNKTVWTTWLSTLEGQRVQIEVAKESDKTSHEAFGYLYACVYKPLADSLGYTVLEVDGLLKKKFLTVKITKQIKGKTKVFTYVKDKRDLNKADLAEFTDSCIMICAENGVVVLPANKYKP
jgi:hypothetical protein